MSGCDGYQYMNVWHNHPLNDVEKKIAIYASILMLKVLY